MQRKFWKSEKWNCKLCSGSSAPPHRQRMSIVKHGVFIEFQILNERSTIFAEQKRTVVPCVYVQYFRLSVWENLYYPSDTRYRRELLWFRWYIHQKPPPRMSSSFSWIVIYAELSVNIGEVSEYLLPLWSLKTRTGTHVCYDNRSRWNRRDKMALSVRFRYRQSIRRETM